MTTTEQKVPDENASPVNGDATVSEVLSAWERVFQGVKVKLRTNANLVASDLRLSIKAVVVALISILTIVGLALVLWSALLIGLSLGITSLGFHWLWALLVVIILNCIAIIVAKKILRAALNSIEMQTSVDHLFNSDCEED